MSLQEIEQNKPLTLTIVETAKAMGVNQRFLQMALQQNKFPFGTAVEGERWIYYINTERFLHYMKALDMVRKKIS